MFHAPSTSTPSIPEDRVEAAALRPNLLLFRGKPHLRPVFPLCLPPAAIHPFLPIAVMKPACLRRQVSRQPQIYLIQLHLLLTTPLPKRFATQPHHLRRELLASLQPRESGRQLCTTARGELAQFIASRHRIDRFPEAFVRRSLCRFRGWACSARKHTPRPRKRGNHKCFPLACLSAL